MYKPEPVPAASYAMKNSSRCAPSLWRPFLRPYPKCAGAAGAAPLSAPITSDVIVMNDAHRRRYQSSPPLARLAAAFELGHLCCEFVELLCRPVGKCMRDARENVLLAFRTVFGLPSGFRHPARQCTMSATLCTTNPLARLRA